MEDMVVTRSVLVLMAMASPAQAFVGMPLVAKQVRDPHLRRSSFAVHMVSAPEKVTTGVKRNQHFSKLKVRDMALPHPALEILADGDGMRACSRSTFSSRTTGSACFPGFHSTAPVGEPP